MTSAVGNDSARRARDAVATRRALLEAGGALFHERGYERATVREIGERAGADPALIARYFGGKEGLYLAVLAEEDPHADEQLDPRTFVAEVLRHWDLRGLSPVSRALGALELSDDVLEQVREIVRERMVNKVAIEGPDAALRTEILIALALGI